MCSSKILEWHKMTQLYQFVSLKIIMMRFDTIRQTCVDLSKTKRWWNNQNLGKWQTKCSWRLWSYSYDRFRQASGQKPRRIEHLQSEEPFSSDPHFRTYVHFYQFLRFSLHNLIFTYINDKKSFLHGLVKTYTFINFWEICHLSKYTIKWFYTIIW